MESLSEYIEQVEECDLINLFELQNIAFTAQATPHTSRLYNAVGYQTIAREIWDGLDMHIMDKKVATTPCYLIDGCLHLKKHYICPQLTDDILKN